ncbi:hypothetical protein DICVIV_09940 [Dictyocaulus viviparus]|uniref:glutaminase n=1 Tax=Dictyocaulus viviparus TaxID=29172 RepID=A0A0D8XNS7_DICVI|nr:hypothetical protein DICVIV_09940 [Dictyocaulus viviparus]
MPLTVLDRDLFFTEGKSPIAKLSYVVFTTSEAYGRVADSTLDSSVCPLTNERCVSPQPCRDVLSLMYSCGMYDLSGKFAFQGSLKWFKCFYVFFFERPFMFNLHQIAHCFAIVSDTPTTHHFKIYVDMRKFPRAIEFNTSRLKFTYI